MEKMHNKGNRESRDSLCIDTSPAARPMGRDPLELCTTSGPGRGATPRHRPHSTDYAMPNKGPIFQNIRIIVSE
ncbi:hypothetical protein EVAR_53707_1 [Eumeta japonica]|uniref:Uncharacterized protein n=1 Tax=Eumeta variegata TaxID=151549 RepID=A0A4C1Z298_EUMVA|nr:hypothetical protein EVAR_53707_1 [Eumeta japonica]